MSESAEGVFSYAKVGSSLASSGTEAALLGEMLFLAASLATVLLASLVVTAHWIAIAPLADETEDGFMMIWCNNRPEYRDVSCVWAACAA